jgi:hypothetical protein
VTSAAWIGSGWLPRPDEIADFGAHEFQGDPDEMRRITRDFLRRCSVAEWEIEEICLAEGFPSIARVYRAIGVDYVSLDIQQSNGVKYFDLNVLRRPLEWRPAFDLVNNEGAIEHLINPLNGFQVGHELLKVRGVALHSIPLAGHANRGLMHPDGKVLQPAARGQRLRTFAGGISIGQSQPHGADKRFVVLDREGAPGRTAVIDFVNAWLHVGYAKRPPRSFARRSVTGMRISPLSFTNA